jgi:SAM-dependent methyltransferase
MNEINPKNHYRSLVSRWYDRLLENEHQDIAFYAPIVQQTKGNVLELACGTGRLLVPFLKEGAAIDGLDISQDMLDICQKKLSAMSLSTSLYRQDLVDFKIDKPYALIFISGGSFQLVDDFDLAMTSLHTVYNHLAPGGRFVLDLFPLWSETSGRESGVWTLGRTAQKGDETFLCHSCTNMDYGNQIQRGQYKYELYCQGRLMEAYLDELNLRWYGREEFRLMLGNVGFTRITMKEASIMSTHDKSLVYYAYKE